MRRILVMAALPALLAAAETHGPMVPAQPEAGQAKQLGLLPLSGEAGPAASANPMDSQSTSDLPAHQFYQIVFRLVLGMEELANDADRQGLPGHELRTHYQEAIGLSDPEALLLRRIAAESQWLMAKEDERSREFIAWYTARFAGYEQLEEEDWRDVWDRGGILVADRRRIMKNLMFRLQSLLGPEATAKVEAYIRKELTPCISLTPLASDATPF